jgi:hypothetical protein
LSVFVALTACCAAVFSVSIVLASGDETAAFASS